MKKLVLLLLITTGLFAQNEPAFLFANKENNLGYGGTISTTLSTKDTSGNTYLIGTFANLADFDPSAAVADLTSISSADMYIAKYDSNGNYLWAKNIGGTGTIDPSAIVIGGNFIYLAGNYNSTVDFDPSTNVSNLTTTNSLGSGFIAKYDLNGFFVLSKSIDGIGTITINDVKFLSNQVVITGYLTETMDLDPSVNTLELTSNGLSDTFIAKYSTSLLVQSAINFGGTSNDTATSLALDSSGNIIISGSYQGTVDFDPSGSTSSLTSTTTSISNTFIAKYTSGLVFQWVKDIGGRSTTSSISKFVLDSTNNILITGSYTSTSDFDPSVAIVSLTASNSDIFIAKYDANGNYVWAKKIGGTSTDYSRNIAIDTSNNIHIYGTFTGIVDFDPNAGITNLDSVNGTNYFAKYDNNGSFVYASNLNTTISTLLVDNSNALVISGSFIGNRDFDPSIGAANLYSLRTSVFLAKYAIDGAYVFAKPIGGDKPSNAVTNFVATDGTGNIYRAGSLSATTDLDPSATVFNLSSISAPGVFIAKYTPNGGLLWAKSFSGGTTLGVSLMNTDTNGNTYITGRFLGTVDFDPSTNTANLTSNSTTLNDMYIAKYDSNGNYLWVKQLSGNVGGTASKRMLFDSVGNFYFTGRISGTDPIDFDPSPTAAVYLTPVGGVDTFFAKYSPQGNYIWAKSISGVDSSSGMNETHIELKGNNIYLTGLFVGSYKFNPATADVITSSQGNLEGFIAKYDLNGNYVFAFSIPTTNSGESTLTANVVVDNSNNFYLFTLLSGSADFDLLSTSASYITSPLLGIDLTTSFILSKYSQTGDLLWAKSLNQNTINFGTNRDRVHAYINNNELIVAFPLFDSEIDLDPSGNDFIVNSNPLKGNIIVAKYNTSTGDFIWGNKIGGDYNSFLNSTNFDSNANLLLSGSFTGTADFDFSSGVQNLTSVSSYNNDRFWAKYVTNTLGLGENIIAKGYVIYPNPTNSMLYVSHESEGQSKVTIIDIMGKILQKTTIDNQKGVDVSAYPQGVYFIQIESGLDKNTYKFIKE